MRRRWQRRDRLCSSSLRTAHYENGKWRDHGEGPGSSAGDYINWLTIRNQEASVIADVERIRNYPLVPRDIPIHGFVYHVESGRLVEVPTASALGRAA